MASNLTLIKTTTYNANDSISQGFLYSIEKYCNCWLIALWIKLESEDGIINSIKGSDQVGNAYIEFTDIGKDRIPGFCCYYWINIDNRTLSTISYTNQRTCKKELICYLENFANFLSSFVVLDKDDISKIAGYSDSNISIDKAKFHILLKTRYKQNELTNLINNSKNITSTIIKFQSNYTEEIELSQWQNLLRFFKLVPYEDNSLKTIEKYELEVKRKFSKEEISKLIEDWKFGSSNEPLKYNDRGFKADGKIYWLSGSFDRSRHKVNFNFHSNKIDTHKLGKILIELLQIESQ